MSDINNFKYFANKQRPRIAKVYNLLNFIQKVKLF